MSEKFLFTGSPAKLAQHRALFEQIRQAGCQLEPLELEALAQEREKSTQALLIGGDGSLNYYINSIMRTPRGTMLPLVYLCAGTGNDFARLFPDREPTIENFLRLKDGKLMEIPIAKCNNVYFINAASGGSLAEVTASKELKIKENLGRLTYFLEGAKKALDIKYQEYLIDNGAFEKRARALGFLVAQGAFAGGGVKISSSTRLHGGPFECAFFLENSMLKHLKAFLELQKDFSHLSRETVFSFRSEKLKISSSREIKVKLDGEPYASRELLFSRSSTPLLLRT